MPIVTRKHGAVVFDDNTGTPIAVTASPGEGNFTISGIEEDGWNAESVKDRGAHYEWVYTQEAEVSGSIAIMHDGDLTDATTERVLDLVAKTGAFASGTGYESDGEVWTCRATATWTAHGVVHTLQIANCRVTADYAEGETGNTITINFRGFGSVTKSSAAA